MLRSAKDLTHSARTSSCRSLLRPKHRLSPSLHRATLKTSITPIASFHSNSAIRKEDGHGQDETLPDLSVRQVTLDNGIEAIIVSGGATSYLNPHINGSIKDRLVDPRLVDEYGVWSINDLTEGQLAEYFADEAEYFEDLDED